MLLPCPAPQIKPVNDEVLGLSPRDLLLARTAVLLAAGAVQLALVRPLVQRYADTALTGWHQLKHGVLSERGGPGGTQVAGAGRAGSGVPGAPLAWDRRGGDLGEGSSSTAWVDM